MIDDLLKEYAEKFGEAFPLFAFPNDDEILISAIKKCIENNTIYKPEYDGEVLY